MTIQSGNVFIVQTAESNRNGRSKGSQISLINKQSALYKYRQQKKQGDRRSPIEERQSQPARSFGSQQSSWLLESRPPSSTQTSDDSASDPESPPFEDDYGSLPLARRKYQKKGQLWDFGMFDDVQLHDCYAGLRTDPFSCMPAENSSTVLGVSDLCQSDHSCAHISC